MGLPQINSNEPIMIYSGLRVEKVKKYGSDAQKLAVDVFDENNDKILQASEVKAMNAFDLIKEENELRLQSKENKKSSIVLKYNQETDLQQIKVKRISSLLSDPYFQVTDNKGRERFTVCTKGDKGNINVDIANAKLDISDACIGDVVQRYMSTNIENSDFANVYSQGGSINFKDSYSHLFRVGKVITDGKTIINADEKLNVNPKTDEKHLSNYMHLHAEELLYENEKE